MTITDVIQFANLLVSASVGVIVWWYTKETQKLRTAAQQQNEIASAPLVLLEIVSEASRPGESMMLKTERVRNIGNGPAFNVNVDPIRKAPFEIRFELAPLLEHSAWWVLEDSIWRDDEHRGWSQMKGEWLDSVIESGGLGAEIPVGVTYSGSTGKRYRSTHLIKFDATSKRVTTVFQSQMELES